MSIALGNEKPEQLLDVEKIIWRTLFTMSEATKPPEEVLNDMLNEIPWQKLTPCLTTTQQVSEWFTLLPTSHIPDNDAMDDSPDQLSPRTVNPTQSTDAENSPTSHIPDNDAMDESPDQLSPHTVNPPQSTDADNSPASAPTINPPPPPPTVNQRQSSATNDFEGFGTLNKNDTDSDDTDSDDDSTPTESEPGVEESTYRRSKRLADSLGGETSGNNLTLTSPLASGFPKSKKYKPTRPLKRKAPTGELSHEGTRGRPIDVDALHAVLDRFPLKREPQVSETRSLNRNFADKFSRD
jgi:hypothetical protein